MNRAQIEALLNDVRAGHVNVDEAMDRLRGLPFEDLGFARVDHHRSVRQGFPEVVLGLGKTPQQIAAIAEAADRSWEITSLALMFETLSYGWPHARP